MDMGGYISWHSLHCQSYQPSRSNQWSTSRTKKPKASMMKSMLVACVLCVAVVSAWDVKPDFCKGDDCPQYEVVGTYGEYEIREYAPSVWAVTRYRANNMLSRYASANDGFMKLFQYISGDNIDDQKIDMTRPVRTVVKNCDATDCSKFNHEMGFFLTYDTAANAPTPLSSDVEIVEVPATKYYVRSFPGYVFERRFNREVSRLASAIDNESAFDNTYHINSGYNSPMEIFGRHNEVMLEVVEAAPEK